MSEQFITPDWPAPDNITALTTLRSTIITELWLPHTLVLPKQVHGTTVANAAALQHEVTEADAVFTTQRNTICAIRTADCLPLLLCDKAGTQVAAIHAGWRGLAAGIIANTCQQFAEPLDQLLVWLGPAIGAKSFEVGADVLAGFAAHGWSHMDIMTAFQPIATSTNKWLGDLYHLARVTLQQQGVLNCNIYGGDYCTYTDPQRFFSYRRSADAGRMVSLIWIK